jgi:DNA-directed RNA polymerase subunit RPC12/RpoP
MDRKASAGHGLFPRFVEKYPDEESCRAAIFRIHWPLGFACTDCGHTRYYPVSGRGQYECSACGRQFSLTGRTVMHKSRVPLHKWFWAVALYTDSPDISAAEMSRKLGLSKPTAWLLLKKIRQGLTYRKGQYFLGKMAAVE